MGIEVLPPDVNASNWILPSSSCRRIAAAGRSTSRIAYSFPVPQAAAIRYGLAAVKNVGEGPAQAISAARARAAHFAPWTSCASEFTSARWASMRRSA